MINWIKNNTNPTLEINIISKPLVETFHALPAAITNSCGGERKVSETGTKLILFQNLPLDLWKSGLLTHILQTLS